MIKYKIISVSDKIVENKLCCLMFVEVNTEEIKSTSFTIHFVMPPKAPTKDFIEKKIREKIQYIKAVEKVKKTGKQSLLEIKNNFLNEEGVI